MLRSNYPRYLPESADFVVLSAGIPYDVTLIADNNEDDNGGDEEGALAEFSLRHAKRLAIGAAEDDGLGVTMTMAALDSIRYVVDDVLAGVGVRFAVVVCLGSTETVWVFNEPFGFIPFSGLSGV